MTVSAPPSPLLSRASYKNAYGGIQEYLKDDLYIIFLFLYGQILQ